MTGDKPIRDPRLDFKTHREKTIEKTDSGATIETFTRFDGSVDKVVKVKSLKLKVNSNEFSPDHIAAFKELQAASQHFIIAKHSNNDMMLEKATIRLEHANVRLMEVQ